MSDARSVPIDGFQLATSSETLSALELHGEYAINRRLTLQRSYSRRRSIRRI